MSPYGALRGSCEIADPVLGCRPSRFSPADLPVSSPPVSPAAQPIGVFDSGVGGLTVAAALRRRLPHERMLYLGDTARLPYGPKSPAVVTRYALQAANFLARQGIKLLVIACNTASAHALAAVSQALAPIPVLGVIAAGAAQAARVSSGGVVVIATEGTCRSNAFPRALGALRPDLPVRQIPCPLFVPLAEEGLIAGPIAEAMVRRYLDTAFASPAGPDTLLLGCTHYPLLRPTLRAVLGPGPALVDCGEAVASQTDRLLAERALAAPPGPGGIALLATDAPDRFARQAQTLLPGLDDGLPVEQVSL